MEAALIFARAGCSPPVRRAAFIEGCGCVLRCRRLAIRGSARVVGGDLRRARAPTPGGSHLSPAGVSPNNPLGRGSLASLDCARGRNGHAPGHGRAREAARERTDMGTGAARNPRPLQRPVRAPRGVDLDIGAAMFRLLRPTVPAIDAHAYDRNVVAARRWQHSPRRDRPARPARRVAVVPGSTSTR